MEIERAEEIKEKDREIAKLKEENEVLKNKKEALSQEIVKANIRKDELKARVGELSRGICEPAEKDELLARYKLCALAGATKGYVIQYVIQSKRDTQEGVDK